MFTRAHARWIPACVAAAMTAGVAHAQWTVTNLHPAGADESSATGVSGEQQVGIALFGSSERGGLWNGSAASWQDLTPPFAANAWVHGVRDGQQVGQVMATGLPVQAHAGIWSGTPATWLDLHPASATQSEAKATDGAQQGGAAQVGGVWQAALWSGSAATWVNLAPAGTVSSWVNGVSDGTQVGWVELAGAAAPYRASLWNGTAASWVSLHPAGSTFSQAHGVHAGQQVGEARIGGADHAGLWTGTAASWVDLHPAGAVANSSGAYAVHAGIQVGWVGSTAALWTGSAASWVNLHALLPPGFSYSVATGVWSDAEVTRVVGRGHNTSTNRVEALLWTRTICRPDLTTTALPGSPGYGVPNGTLNNDDFFYYIAQFAAGNLAAADLTTTALPGTPGYGVPNGVLNNDDFFYYITIFAAGC